MREWAGPFCQRCPFRPWTKSLPALFWAAGTPFFIFKRDYRPRPGPMAGLVGPLMGSLSRRSFCLHATECNGADRAEGTGPTSTKPGFETISIFLSSRCPCLGIWVRALRGPGGRTPERKFLSEGPYRLPSMKIAGPMRPGPLLPAPNFAFQPVAPTIRSRGKNYAFGARAGRWLGRGFTLLARNPPGPSNPEVDSPHRPTGPGEVCSWSWDRPQ